MNITNFNKGWLYWADRSAFALVLSVPKTARKIDLPHDAMLEQPARPDSPNGRNTGFRDGGIYTYVKRFDLKEALADSIISLRFDGVYMNASVYVNGQRAAFHPYGYTAFDVRIDTFLRPGPDNEIRVTVNNSAMPNSRWYSGGGIYRDVWLCVGAKVHIPPMGLQVRTLAADEHSAQLSIQTHVDNLGEALDDAILDIRLLDGSGHEVARDRKAVGALPPGSTAFIGEITVPAPSLWSAETPVLYQCEVTLLHGEIRMDTAATTFGIRTIRLDPARGLLINDRETKLRGACVHHDHGLLGAVSLYDAEYRRVMLLKEAGFNAIRMAHHPAGPNLLRACDMLGVYVMDEAFDTWTRPKADNDYAQHFDDWWARDLQAMSGTHFNHPSVILVSVGNEIPEAATPAGLRITKAMTDLLHTLDPDSPVLAAVNGVFAAGDAMDAILADLREQLRAENVQEWNVNDFLTAMGKHMDRIVQHREITQRLDSIDAITDVAGYNYMSPRYEKDADAYPQRFIVGSETYPPDIARNWALVSRLPRVIGDFTWTGWDYIGEVGVGCPSYGPKKVPFGLGYPCQLAYCGDFDITGFRRPLSYLREIVFGLRNEPYIAVQNPKEDATQLNRSPWMLSDALPSWTWPGHEGQRVTVEVYAPGDEVELLVNGVSLGRKPYGAAAGFRALFEAVYQPGEVRAIVHKDGRVVGESALATAGPPRTLTVSAWTGPQKTLVYADIAVLDNNGRLADKPDIQLTARVSGGAELLGFGTGNPMPIDNFRSMETTTFHGHAQAVIGVKDGGKSFTLHVSGGGMVMSAAYHV